MTDHVPGPWHSSKTSVVCFYGTRRIQVATARQPLFTLEAQAANARLIAAAPELLEACWEAINALSLAARFCPDETQEGRPLSVRAQVIHESELIMAAIIKATAA